MLQKKERVTHLWQSKPISGTTKYDVVAIRAVYGTRGATQPTGLIILDRQSRGLVRISAATASNDAGHPSSFPNSAGTFKIVRGLLR